MKTRFDPAVTLIVVGVVLLLTAASGPVITRLRDLQDVKLATTVADGSVLVYNTAAARWTNGSASVAGVVDGLGVANTLPKWSDTNTLTSIANGVGMLTNDGAGGFGFTTNISQDVNINNLTVNTNLVFVNGNGNRVTITQQLFLEFMKTNLLATDASGMVTSAVYGTGIAWDPSTRTLSSTVSSDTTFSNVVTLTMTGTNVSQMDFSLVQNGGVFKLALTGNAYVGAPANVATSPFRKAWLIVQQPSTGTCLLQFTNGHFAWPERVSPVMDTNNGSVAVFQFISDVFTNGLLHGSMTPWSGLATNM